MTRRELLAGDLLSDPEFLQSAVNFTAGQTGFPPRLVEKDYFCTLLLEYLTKASELLVFKGGTCLAKVHTDFFRLSEDLDFVIPMSIESTRTERSRRARQLVSTLADLTEQFPTFRWIKPFRGFNNSTQYNGEIGYRSSTGEYEDTIKIEVSLREPLVLSAPQSPIRTLLVDPKSLSPLISPLSSLCICRTEAYAEKFRAALSRRRPAIRDFFDLDYATRKLGIRPDQAEFIALVREKLAVSGNPAVDVSAARFDALRQQVEPELRAVLRAVDFAEFDLNRAFQTVTDLAARLT